MNNYETNKPSGLADLKRKGNGAYTEDVLSLSKGELKTMFDNGEIVDIDR
jgi:hypothetical protein